VVLFPGEVVVAVDALGFGDVLAGERGDGGDGAVHHLLAVEQGELLGPA